MPKYPVYFGFFSLGPELRDSDKLPEPAPGDEGKPPLKESERPLLLLPLLLAKRFISTRI
jgi:hypothetical protein